MKADHTQVTRLLKTARGQIDGILKMVEEDRYCLEVSSQIMAAQSILKKANRMVLKAHMDCCVREAVASGAPDEKLEELAALLCRRQFQSRLSENRSAVCRQYAELAGVLNTAAAELGAELIVSHHPVIFRPAKSVTDGDPDGRVLLALAEHRIAAI